MQGFLLMGQSAKCIETIIYIAIVTSIVSFNKKIFFSEFRIRIR